MQTFRIPRLVSLGSITALFRACSRFRRWILRTSTALIWTGPVTPGPRTPGERWPMPRWICTPVCRQTLGGRTSHWVLRRRCVVAFVAMTRRMVYVARLRLLPATRPVVHILLGTHGWFYNRITPACRLRVHYAPFGLLIVRVPV